MSFLCIWVPGTFLALQLNIFICADAFMICEPRNRMRIHVRGRRGKFIIVSLTQVEVETQQVKEQQEGDEAQY